MSEVLHSFIENMVATVDGLIGLSVTDISSGECYETYSATPDFNTAIASAYNLEVVKAKIAAIKALNLNEEIDEISITLTSQIHNISVSPSGTYFIYTAIDSTKANLGITRGLLKKYKQDLNTMF